MERLTDFIQVYDNALENNICDYLIEHFEISEKNHKRILRNRSPNFTQYNLSRHAWKNGKTNQIYRYLINKIHSYSMDYFNFYSSNFDCDIFPSTYGIERFRIKRYNTGVNEAYDAHVDSKNLITSPRFLSFLWYLNDVDAGGQTIFWDMEIKPKRGRLVIFPPFWLFPHIGEEPISNPKYIMSSYLRYNKLTKSLKRLWEILQ